MTFVGGLNVFRSWSRASSARAVARLDYATRDRFITGHVTDVFEWVGEACSGVAHR